MIKALVQNIKTNIAQATEAFSETQPVTLKTISNRIYDTGLSGEYTLSGAVHTNTDFGCANNTYTYTDGETVAECFFGDEEQTIEATAHQVRIGTAVSRDKANELMQSGDDSLIIVYMDSMANANQNKNYSVSEDLTLKAEYTLGVMYRIPIGDMQECDSLDEVLISSALGAKAGCSTLIHFDKVNSRFIFGKSYIIDISLSYEKNIDINAIIQNRAKAFESNGFNIKQGE